MNIFFTRKSNLFTVIIKNILCDTHVLIFVILDILILFVKKYYRIQKVVMILSLPRLNGGAM
jgi:hypothetical protein